MDSPGTSHPDKKSPFDDLSREDLIVKCKGLLSIAQKAKQVKQESKNEVESYKLQLEKCISEKNQYQDSFKTLQELVDSLTEQKLNIITEVDSAQSQIKALSVQCKNYEDEIQKYKADLIVKNQVVSNVNIKLSDLDSEVISLKRQNNRLVEENEQLINQLTEIEVRTTEFNNIGLQQREQLKILEESVHADEELKIKLEELNCKIHELEIQLEATNDAKLKQEEAFESKLKETTQLYESEKSKKEKANVKLRSYKDKILKCAACINQLKNSRFILTKTVKEYSENIPKWRNDIINASKVLDEQIHHLNNENSTLKEEILVLKEELEKYKTAQKDKNPEIQHSEIDNSQKDLPTAQITELQQQYNVASNQNIILQEELPTLKLENKKVKENKIQDIETLQAQIAKLEQQYNEALSLNLNLQENLAAFKLENQKLCENQMQEKETIQTQIAKLEQQYNEASILNLNLQEELAALKLENQKVNENQMEEKETLQAQIAKLGQQYNEASILNTNLQQELAELKVVNQQLNEGGNQEKKSIKAQITELEHRYNEASRLIVSLQQELAALKLENQQLSENGIPAQINENKALKEQIDVLHRSNVEIKKSVNDMKVENKKLNGLLQNKAQDSNTIETLNFQIKALESEKATLLKEKLNAKDSVIELENNNKILTDQNNKLNTDIQAIKRDLERVTQEKARLGNHQRTENEGEMNTLKSKIMAQQEQFELLKKEYDNIQDLNNLLKEEVETLKLSLEQPKDDNQSDLNVSLQADVVKLETKLAAYKQENASLLSEVKESRSKVKEFDAMTAEYEENKSKLQNYKSENTELLREMKEINQVLKERGESISKQQKAIAEMERLIETLEKDRDNANAEKNEVLKKVETLESELKNAEKKTCDNSGIIELVVSERNNALKQLTENENIITSLKEEIEKLKHNSSSSELPNEDMSTSTISKAEECSRMKDLDETFEDKYTKLRIFALKLKKKLNETIALLQSAEQDKAKLEKMLSDSGYVDKTVVKRSSDAAPDHCAGSGDTSELLVLQTKVNSLTEESEKITADLEKVKAELDIKNRELASEIEAHKATKNSLEKAKRDVKKKSVLSLEMEDYERSLKELTTKMEEKKKKMVQMESTIDTQEGTITAMKTQIYLLEEQIKSEETQNRLTKEELQHIIEEGKDKDNFIQAKNAIILKLEQDLEDEKRKNEEADLEMTSVISDKEKVIMSLGEDKAELNNKVKRLEFRCSELNEKLKIATMELADLKTEYTSYKVRAQAVLRQNQTVDHSQEEQLKEEAAALRAQIETMTTKLNIALEQCAEQTNEAENARRRASEAASEAARAQQRTARLHADLTRISQQLDSERTQHKLQISTLTQCYKTQISDLEAKLVKETELLKKQLTAVQDSVKSGKVTVLDQANNQYMLPVIPKDDSDGEMDINVSMIPREEGEGSESAPSPPPSKPFLSGASGRSPVPLDRLLEEGVPEDEPLDTSSLDLTSEQEIADLKRRFTATQQRVKHVTVLLSESERECARLAQLSELLKAELRRVRGTTNNAHNAQYMKNVTLKFLTLPPGDERTRLVPVLQKILTLTQTETQQISAVAKGLDPNPSKGWGSYLPWPGGSK